VENRGRNTAMDNFNSALRSVMQVSKKEMAQILQDEKAKTPPRTAGRKPKSVQASK
jgi:hypothetical protein